MNDPTVQPLAEKFRNALQANDWRQANALLSDDALIHITGRNVLSGTFRGNEHIATTYRWVRRELDAAIDVVEVIDLLVSEERAALLVRERAQRSVATIEYRRLIVLTIAEGEIRELWAIAEDPYALDGFWE